IEILIVEDDPVIAIGLRDDLELEGYSTEVVSTGDIAVHRACEKRFALILLDIMLPRKDGLEVCRELRRSGVDSGIILLTAKKEEADKILGLEMGADDYITKPFSSRELRSRVKALLRRCVPRETGEFHFGDIAVSFSRCAVYRGGEQIDL